MEMQVIEMAWLLAVIGFLTIPFGRWDVTIGFAAAGIALYAILKLILFELRREAKEQEKAKPRQ